MPNHFTFYELRGSFQKSKLLILCKFEVIFSFSYYG